MIKVNVIIKSSIKHWNQLSFSIELRVTKPRTACMMNWGFSRLYSSRTHTGTRRVAGLSIPLCGMLCSK